MLRVVQTQAVSFFKINVGMSRIRHRTPEKMKDEVIFPNRLKMTSDPTLSEVFQKWNGIGLNYPSQWVDNMTMYM